MTHAARPLLSRTSHAAILSLLAASAASAQTGLSDRITPVTLNRGPAAIHISASQGTTFTRHTLGSTPARVIDEGEVWENLDYEANGTFFFNLDDEPSGLFGHEAGDWGDVADGTFVQSIAIAYATDLPDPNFVGIEGLDMVVNFYSEYLGFGEPAVLIATIIIEDLPGAETAGEFSMISGTIDLTVTNTEFCVTGPDLDGDNLTDFGYGYSFVQDQAGGPGTIGPMMVLPATLGGAGNATGVEDAFDEYEAEPMQAYIGTFNFGANPPTLPVASFFMALDNDGSSCPTGGCYADCDPSTGAGVLDVFDFLCFQSSFVAGEPYACDCTTSTGAGVCDIFDFLCFQSAFVNGCP